MFALNCLPSTVDKALLAPGRFDLHLFVPPPDHPGRVQILSRLCFGSPVVPPSAPPGEDAEHGRHYDVFGVRVVPHLISLADVASNESQQGATGATLRSLCKQAALSAMRRHAATACEEEATPSAVPVLQQGDFDSAMAFQQRMMQAHSSLQQPLKT